MTVGGGKCGGLHMQLHQVLKNMKPASARRPLLLLGDDQMGAAGWYVQKERTSIDH